MNEQYNAADHREVTRAKREAKRQAEQENADLRAVLALPEGRRLMLRIFEHCGLYQTPFNQNAALMSKNCGLQDAALWLLAEIREVVPEAHLLMQTEHYQARRAEQERLKREAEERQQRRRQESGQDEAD